jgi:hypothetical protein
MAELDEYPSQGDRLGPVVRNRSPDDSVNLNERDSAVPRKHLSGREFFRLTRISTQLFEILRFAE